MNIRGFGDDAKQRAIFDFAKNSHADFVCLQETLVSDSLISTFRSKWKGSSFWSPALGKQGGTVILVPENSDFEIKKWQRDSSGRIVSILASLGDFNFNIVNIYAPTNLTERKCFYESLHDFFFPNALKIIVGDFNCVENASDKHGGVFSQAKDLIDFRTQFKLIDIWQKLHGRQTECTWFNSDQSIGTRLDKFLIDPDLSANARTCEIIPFVLSDHDSVHLSLDLHDIYTGGPGIWRLNLDLLKDELFCSQISELICTHVDFIEAFPSIHEWWDFLKESIKETALIFGREKSRKLNRDRVHITNHLIDARRDFLAGNVLAKQTIDNLESELKAILVEQQRSVHIRSRAQWLEEGERPSKYFFKLESHRAQKHAVKSVLNSADVEVTSKDDIEQAHFDFYSRLYSAEQTDVTFQNEFLSQIDTSLTDNERDLCEGELDLTEITSAMRDLSPGKTPGPDGLPQEFYAKFWNLLAPHLLRVFNFSLEQGFLCDYMRENVTRLLFKKGDKKLLKNWRPISLLNVDYKICSKALANRLAKVLSSIINEDQTCSVPGRTIFENLALFRDVLDHVNITNETGILVSLDQEKAFDRVDHSFLRRTLERFGFGPGFLRWISTLYHGASMKIIVNGFLTEKIFLKRGVRQGDSLSPLLYVICAEVLAQNIRNHNGIQGFLLPGAHSYFKLRQYADDSTCFVKDTFSLHNLFYLLRKFERGTGAKLNLSKTKAMWLGAWRARPDTPLGLSWVQKMKICGVWFSNGLVNVDPDNWLPRISKLESNINLWKCRSLSLIRKVLVINILGASKFWFLAKVLPTPEWVISRFKKLVFPFLWGSKIETVGRKSLSVPVHKGGLGLIDFMCKSKALKVSALVNTIDHPDTKDFLLMKYFTGSQLARVRGEWSHLRDNSSPSALAPSKYYECVFNSLTTVTKRIPSTSSFCFSSKNCYTELLKDAVSVPVLPYR